MAPLPRLTSTEIAKPGRPGLGSCSPSFLSDSTGMDRPLGSQEWEAAPPSSTDGLFTQDKPLDDKPEKLYPSSMACPPGMAGIGELGKRRCTPNHVWPCLDRIGPGEQSRKSCVPSYKASLCSFFHGWPPQGWTEYGEPPVDVTPSLPWQNYPLLWLNFPRPATVGKLGQLFHG